MSIADALNEVKIKISDVYTKCSEKGATLPDIQNLENLPATIDSVKSGGIEVVQAYYNDTDIEAGKKVFLTNVGYTVTGSDTFSPNVRPTIINENGFVIAGSSRYQIVNGVVDESTQTSVTDNPPTAATHFFMHNGAVSACYPTPTMAYVGDNVYLYTMNNSARTTNYNLYVSYVFLDWGVCNARYSGDITVVNEDLTTEKITLSSYLSGISSNVFAFGTRDLFYFIYPTGWGTYNVYWALAKLEKIDGNYVATSLNTSVATSQRDWEVAVSLFVNTKTKVQTTVGEAYHCLGSGGFISVEINKEDETQSQVGFYSYPQNVLDVMGDRTVAVIQTFYDGTFSLCLNEGTTLICKFTSATEAEVLQVIEPFMVEGDSTIYYRNFTATKMYWWQSGNPNAPISSNPYGPYNATRAVTNYLAVDPLESRFNSTVLTGFLTGQVDTIEGREVVGVKTATKGTTLIDYSDVVNCYVSGVTLGQPKLNSTGTELEPSSVCDVDVLLTKVGYQATGSETLSPSVRLYYINENGWAIDEWIDRYDIVNGVIDTTTKADYPSSIYGINHLPLFFKNGNVYGFLSTTSMTITNSSTGYMDTFSYETSKRITVWSSNMNTRTFFLDFGYATSFRGCTLVSIKDDLSTTGVDLGNLSSDIYSYDGGNCYVAGLESKFWVLSRQSNGTGKLIEFVKNGDTYVPTLLSTQAISTSALSMPQGSIFVASKQVISTDNGFVTHTLHKNGYIKFNINTQNSSESLVTFNAYPQWILDFIGNRTVYKIQCFYDNTFSLDLSDGTTLICGFGGDNYEPIILEVVEPFIIEGDTNIYHRNFSERKMYWIQADKPLAPLSSNPLGLYNATKATVDWLAVPREQNRWNTTVLTGVIRQSAQLAKPVFDDTGRRVLQVETTIKKNNCNDNATYEWTLGDYNKVVDKQG